MDPVLDTKDNSISCSNSETDQVSKTDPIRDSDLIPDLSIILWNILKPLKVDFFFIEKYILHK
jgi:hypothetical protein